MARGGLSKDPYKGVRDFYPEDMAVLKYLFGVMRKTAESFGYVEYSASPLEPSELYEGKTSEEIVREQTYNFTDRGERKVTLRPEMTPTLARMIAAKKRDIPLPIRWYSIPNIFRYEQPQKGRLREHYQLNVDLLGISSIEADVEIISLAYRIMKAFGAKDEDFIIKISSRKWIDWLALELGDPETSQKKKRDLLRLLDTKEKITEEKFLAGLKELGLSQSLFSVENILPGAHENLNLGINEVISSLKKLGVNNVIFDPSVVRGFDYYTGIIFEVFDTSSENRRSIFGGGRYDKLLEIFGEEPIPAVGFGMGDVTLHDFLETHNLLSKMSSAVDLAVCLTEDSSPEFVTKIVDAWRQGGLNVAVDWTGRKIGDQIKAASKQGIPFMVVLSKKEMESGKVMLKELESGKETELSISEVSNFIKKLKART